MAEIVPIRNIIQKVALELYREIKDEFESVKWFVNTTAEKDTVVVWCRPGTLKDVRWTRKKYKGYEVSYREKPAEFAPITFLGKPTDKTA